MSFFDKPTSIVNIDDENSITLRALTWGEEQAIKQACMKVKADATGQGSAEVDPVEIELKTFRLAIVAWAGPGFDGRQVSPENIAALPSWIIDKLKGPYNELSVISTAEKKV